MSEAGLLRGCCVLQTSTKLYLVLDFVNGGHLFFQLYRQVLATLQLLFSLQHVCHPADLPCHATVLQAFLFGSRCVLHQQSCLSLMPAAGDLL